ncbi:aspartate carbamoyltransferase [Candidatus Saccharibacteria bacterium]|nr:aspartate carbamoyltransferase [Candidatus Saccharibacteria bacterium]
MRHILNAEQFEPVQLSKLFNQADYFKETDKKLATRRENMRRHWGRIMLSMFYEPSTRTRFSFELAAKKLGMDVVGTENAAEFSSAAKGETIEDTIRVFNGYGADALSLRTKENGMAKRAAKVADIAILNGGDGKGEHPTQAALDTYTIHSEFGQLHNLNVTIGGDLSHGRTARSLALLLSKYPGNDITFVSTPELRIGDDIKEKLVTSGTSYTETDTVDIHSLGDADVVYWTRLQLERLDGLMSKEDAAKKQKEYRIDAATLEIIPDHAIIMHPLPRVDEITTDVDNDHRARFFQQAWNGLYVRMAMLDQLMNETNLRENN